MSTQNTTDDKTNFFATKTFEVEFLCGDLHYEIEVETPDLSSCSTKVWADWGPMYTCTLGREQEVNVTYSCVETGRKVRYSFHPPTIALNSPARVARRSVQPLVLELMDVARGLKLTAHMNAEGEVVETHASRISAALDVNALVFCELDHASHADPLDAPMLASAE